MRLALGMVMFFLGLLGFAVLQDVGDSLGTVDDFQLRIGFFQRRAEELLHSEAVDDQHVGLGQLAHVLRGEAVIVGAAHLGRDHQVNLNAGRSGGDIAGYLVDGKGGGQHLQVLFRRPRRWLAQQENGAAAEGDSPQFQGVGFHGISFGGRSMC